MRHYFYYHGYATYIKGFHVESVIIGSPVPRKNEITIPYRNSVIDMEKVVGYPVYDDRTITAKFWCRVSGRGELLEKQTEVERWLLHTTQKSDFIDSESRDYAYHAYCSSLDFGDSTAKFLRCTATFRASPHKREAGTNEEVL